MVIKFDRKSLWSPLHPKKSPTPDKSLPNDPLQEESIDIGNGFH
jgi:hypothetical protein